MVLNDYRCRAIAVLVTLHESHLRSFIETWKAARLKNVKLPETSDPDYESIQSLLYHVLNSSRNYLLWLTRNLKLEYPPINEVPPPEEIEENIANYSEHLLQNWKIPLKNSQEVILDKVFKSNWGVDFSVEAMLEHAVMHPIRHEFQLKGLIEKKAEISTNT